MSKFKGFLRELKNDVFMIITLGLLVVSMTILLNCIIKVYSIPSKQDLTSTSVKIVRSDKQSGGSGVILFSSTYKSVILTNHHVCGVIVKGGLVIRDNEEHAVVTYKYSKFHDLCLITVAADLGVRTRLAKSAPNLLDSATVVGHPHLQPTTITKGHFSNHEMIDIMTGIRACTADDLAADPNNTILCAFLGGIPQITRYEAQMATPLIQPGSSGSPVFNEYGELSGLVFAGSGDLGFAMIVPYESVASFLKSEAPNLPELLPNNVYEVSASTMNQKALADESLQNNIEKMCKEPQNAGKSVVKRICTLAGQDMVWRH